MKSIRNNLLASFLTVIAVLVISEMFLIATNSILITKYRNLNDAMISEYSLIKSTDDLVESFYLLMKSSNDQTTIKEFRTNRQETLNLIKQIDKIAVDYNSRVAFEGLKNNLDELMYETEIGANDSLKEDYPEAINRYKAAKDKSKFVTNNTTNLLMEQLEYTKNIQTEIKSFEKDSNFIAFIITLFSLGSCLWYAFFFSRKIVSPLSKLTDIAKEIEHGDLTAIAGNDILNGKDEIASLANSFNTMVISLRQNIVKLREDNTEIENSRNNLKLEKNKLQQYLDVAGIIVMTFDTKYKVFLINKKGREILGIKAQEIMGKDWIENFVSPETQENTKIFLKLATEGIQPGDTVENVIVTKDQTKKNIVWHFSSLKNSKGITQTILGTGIDITELTQAKITISQLKELDKFKNEVMNIATHELKTPLISIVGLSEVMTKNPQGMSKEQQEYLTIINQEGQKLTNLIKTMLSTERNEIGKPTINIEKINLSELLLSLEESLKIVANRNKSKIAFDIKDKDTVIETDKTKISQVVYNFVDNASKYGLKEGTITISLEKEAGKNIIVKVHNEGVGIEKELQKKLFNKFSQLEPSLSRSQDGLGLGLYICKQNITAIGGTIGVDSEPGHGTTFYFSLPLNKITK